MQLPLRHSQVPENNRMHHEKEISNLLLEIGFVLREAREKKSLSQKDIREITCIPLSHIHAIENGERNRLPEDVFLLGFIKRYAKVVDLNGQILCKKYLKGIENNSFSKHEDEFSLLFEYKKERNVIPFQKAFSEKFTEINDNEFLKTYHLYVVIGIIMIIFFAFGCVKNLFFMQDKDVATYLVLEKENNNTLDTGFKFNYDDIESWVSDYDLNSKKNKDISSKEIDKVNPDVNLKKQKIQDQTISEYNANIRKINNKGKLVKQTTSLKKHHQISKLVNKNLNKDKVVLASIVEKSNFSGEVKLRPLKTNNITEISNKKGDVPLGRIKIED